MSPPPCFLGDLDPNAIGDAAHALVAQHAAVLADLLGAEVQPERARPSRIRADVRALTEYAKTGSLGPWDDEIGVHDALLRVFHALRARPACPAEIDLGDLTAPGEPDTDLGRVLVAAFARMSLASPRGRLTARELAVLAGVHEDEVLASIAAGTVQAHPDSEPPSVPSDSARAWLCRHGVEGLE